MHLRYLLLHFKALGLFPLNLFLTITQNLRIRSSQFEAALPQTMPK